MKVMLGSEDRGVEVVRENASRIGNEYIIRMGIRGS